MAFDAAGARLNPGRSKPYYLDFTFLTKDGQSVDVHMKAIYMFQVGISRACIVNEQHVSSIGLRPP